MRNTNYNQFGQCYESSLHLWHFNILSSKMQLYKCPLFEPDYICHHQMFVQSRPNEFLAIHWVSEIYCLFKYPQNFLQEKSSIFALKISFVRIQPQFSNLSLSAFVSVRRHFETTLHCCSHLIHHNNPNLREAPAKKKPCIFGHCPNCDLTPPKAQIRALCGTIFLPKMRKFFKQPFLLWE